MGRYRFPPSPVFDPTGINPALQSALSAQDAIDVSVDPAGDEDADVSASALKDSQKKRQLSNQLLVIRR